MSEQSETSVGPLSPVMESRPGLLRVLGPGIAIAIVVGNVIGSGIYAKPGQIAAEGGGFPLILSAWIIGGILCILGSLCFAELAVMLPRSGGMYVYLREAYSRPVAFLYGWTDFIFGRPASIGALSMIFVGSLQQATGWDPGDTIQIALAFGVIIVMAWINVLGVIWGGSVQGLSTALKAGLLALVAALPFVVTLFGSDGIDSNNYRTTLRVEGEVPPTSTPATTEPDAARHEAQPESKTTATIFALVLLSVMWAYNGWHGISSIAEEIREPQRNIPLALFGGIGLLILLYVSANFAYHGVLSMDEMALRENQEHVAEVMVGRLIGPFGVKLMSASVMISVLGAINSNLLLGPRVSFAMGRDDVFFRSLGRVHVNFRTPAAAIVVQALMGMLLIVVSALLIEFVDAFGVDESGEQKPTIFTLLTNYVVFSASIFYMLAVLAVIVLRVKHPDWERPYRTMGMPVTPIAYLVFYAWFLYYVFLGQPKESLIGLGLIAVGLPVYYAYRWWAKRNPEVLHDGQ